MINSTQEDDDDDNNGKSKATAATDDAVKGSPWPELSVLQKAIIAIIAILVRGHVHSPNFRLIV